MTKEILHGKKVKNYYEIKDRTQYAQHRVDFKNRKLKNHQDSYITFRDANPGSRGVFGRMRDNKWLK